MNTGQPAAVAEMVCEQCHELFRFPAKRLRQGRRFCSKSCARKWRNVERGGTSGELNPNWKGGLSADNYRYKKRQMEAHPERVLARDQVKRAIQAGRLERKPCEVCGTVERVQAHHDDYSKPLEVRWLCTSHHREEHDGWPVGRGAIAPSIRSSSRGDER